jgi:hypothetical protein
MVARKRGFYYRRRRSGRDELVFLHTDRGLAEIAYHRCWLEDRTGVQSRPAPEPVAPAPSPSPPCIAEGIEHWLKLGVADRNAKNRAMTRARAKRYLEQFMGSDLLPSVTRRRMLEYREWLETRTKKVRRADGKEEEKLLSRETVRHILADARCMFAGWRNTTTSRGLRSLGGSCPSDSRSLRGG